MDHNQYEMPLGEFARRTADALTEHNEKIALLRNDYQHLMADRAACKNAHHEGMKTLGQRVDTLANDVQDLKGVGPRIEQKLDALKTDRDARNGWRTELLRAGVTIVVAFITLWGIVLPTMKVSVEKATEKAIVSIASDDPSGVSEAASPGSNTR